MNEIVVRGQDGSTWHYHAMHGPDLPPPETGWVLVIENAHEAIDPQALTAADVVGDLHRLQATEPPPTEVVRFFTEQMIETLEQRVAELEQAGRSTEEHRRRLTALSHELTELARGDPAGPSDPASALLATERRRRGPTASATEALQVRGWRPSAV